MASASSQRAEQGSAVSGPGGCCSGGLAGDQVRDLAAACSCKNDRRSPGVIGIRTCYGCVRPLYARWWYATTLDQDHPLTCRLESRLFRRASNGPSSHVRSEPALVAADCLAAT